jgi:23S rRNA pseudouridine1911/1915/1917 synthase
MKQRPTARERLARKAQREKPKTTSAESPTDAADAPKQRPPVFGPKPKSPPPPSLPTAAQPLPNDAPPLPSELEAVETATLPEEELEQVRYEIRHNLQKRLDLYLRDRLPDYSRNMLQKLIKAGHALVNGRPGKNSTLLHSGDVVEVTLPHAPPEEAQPEDIPLDIVYEDEGFLAVNKQAGLIVHPARGHWTGTLINALLWHARETAGTLSSGSDPWRPGIIHRLDRDTTGLIMVAKTDEAHWRLAGQFERRTIRKTYLAIVHGNPPLDSDLIDAPLAVHPKMREKYAVRPDIGKPAQTIYSVRERFDGFALVELAPRTGRTHQLRVHMAHIGHPMVGDTMYGGQPVSLRDLTGRSTDDPTSLIDRQALHAFRLQFVHPLKFHRMILEAPPHADMLHLLTMLRKHRKLKR